MLKVKCSFLNDKFFFFHLSVQKGAFHFTFVLLFFFYSFARKNAQISSHTSFWKKRRSAWSASSIESSVTSHPAFSSSSCSSSPCPNGTVWSFSPWMIRNGGAAFVTKLTGQHASASSGCQTNRFLILFRRCAVKVQIGQRRFSYRCVTAIEKAFITSLM